MTIARKFFISGVVQGVGFRFFVQRSAAKHQVVGYVRNLRDGRVETYAEGDEESVKAFHEDLLTGPKFAEVDEVEEIVVEQTREYPSFRIER